jgi:hypothetical protein
MSHLKGLNLSLAIATMLFAVAAAAPAAAKHRQPLKGVIEAVESSVAVFPPDVPFPTLFVEGVGSGRATQLGRFTVVYDLQVNLNTFFGTGAADFVAANGDTLSTELEGQGTVPNAQGVSWILESHTITGGTGRFSGASGDFLLLRVIDVDTGVTFGVFDGVIIKR